MHVMRRTAGWLAMLMLLSVLPAETASAQVGEKFEVVVPAISTGDERIAQPGLWVMEVRFKPVRMIWVDITDPKTGKKEPQLVWYVVYRAFRRPIEHKAREAERTPVNPEEPPVTDPIFIPNFTLVVHRDNEPQHVYEDEILPEAVAAIRKRERGLYKNSVEIVGTLPPVSPYNGDEEQHPLLGVVTWRNIDPETDFFTIYMSGFSNGFQVRKGPDGERLVLRKTIKQEFWRPGDRFDEGEHEIRAQGDPEWIYRPDPTLRGTAPAAKTARNRRPSS